MGLAARQALGRSSGFGIAYEKNQLSGFQGIMNMPNAESIFKATQVFIYNT